LGLFAGNNAGDITIKATAIIKYLLFMIKKDITRLLPRIISY